ncbi:hypothetical protein PZH43_10980, partial [Streptococcus gordonii]|nr:hypothetical protein [Streptococcus gordonii]
MHYKRIELKVTTQGIHERKIFQGVKIFNAETIAQRVAYNWSQKDNLKKMWGTKNTVSGQEAFQLNII